jgi:hypothetical protein
MEPKRSQLVRGKHGLRGGPFACSEAAASSGVAGFIDGLSGVIFDRV